MTGESFSEEEGLISDPRLAEAIRLFNAGDWYACHDGFEELWHEHGDPVRPLLQGLLQLAVAHLHLERGNLRGATILLGEGLGRLKRSSGCSIGLDLRVTIDCCRSRLLLLQAGEDPSQLPKPRLMPVSHRTP
ncbi:MAG: DUF309 domain-containing protein [Cyanobacteriota bacterium]|nr:DUF309 domain-containing protein [Cyanobacteriota bacterium]